MLKITKEQQELLDYFMANCSWENSYEHSMDNIKHWETHRLIKYFKLIFDTRDNDLWSIEFYGDSNIANTTFSFRLDDEKDIETVYRFLKKEMTEEENKIYISRAR